MELLTISILTCLRQFAFISLSPQERGKAAAQRPGGEVGTRRSIVELHRPNRLAASRQGRHSLPLKPGTSYGFA